MCLKYNTNILVHDLAQKLNFYSKNNIFSGYLLEQNKSLKLKYRKKNLGQKNKSIKTLSEKKYIIAKPKDAKTLFKSAPKYLFPSMNSNLLCENLFQRKSQLLPDLKKVSTIFKNKIRSKYNDIEGSNEKANSKRKTIFLSTTSFDFKKRENSKQKQNIFNSPKKSVLNIMHNSNNSSNSKNIKLLKNVSIKPPLNTPKEKKNNIYYYVIRPENCGYLVKNCFNHRKNWKELENIESNRYNFKWQQNNYRIDFKKLSMNNIKQIVNHFEYKNVISNKAHLFLNMMEFAEMQDINIFKYIPFTVLFDYNKMNFFNKLLKFEYLFKNITDYIVPIYDINDRKYRKIKERLYGYFFPIPNKIGTKTAINIPETHFVTKKIIIDNNNENNNNKLIKVKNNYWLIKAPDLNRGRCIKILNSMIDVKRSIREFSMGIKLGYLNGEDTTIENNVIYDYSHNYNNYEEEKKYIINNNSNSSNSNEDEMDYVKILLNLKEKEFSPHKDSNTNNNYRSDMIIIQKYIENPLLYYWRKFDIRIWALLTQDLKIYVFQEGHLKCCSINYDLNSDNNFVHLTNYSFQKYNSNFGKYEFGNEASFNDLQKNIEANYNNKVNFKLDIFPKIINIIQFVFESVKYKINPLDRKYSFEIFGFDFMLDCDFDPFLIEVNTNPGLEESSPLIKMLVPRMIDDALRLTLDKEFETEYDFGNDNKYSTLYKSPFKVEGYEDSDNLFKFVCDLNNDPNCDVYRNYLNSNNSKPFFLRNNSKI